jgi:uncharacterized membrane protein YbhN (UPF0104 family)
MFCPTQSHLHAQVAYTVGGHLFSAAMIEYSLLKSKSSATHPQIVRISLFSCTVSLSGFKIYKCHEFLGVKCY